MQVGQSQSLLVASKGFPSHSQSMTSHSQSQDSVTLTVKGSYCTLIEWVTDVIICQLNSGVVADLGWGDSDSEVVGGPIKGRCRNHL